MNDALSSPRRELGSLQGGLWLLLQQSRCPSPLPARSLRVLAEQELHGKRFSRRLDSVTSQVFPKLSDSVILWNRGCAAAVPQTQGLHRELQVSFLPQTLPTSGWFPAASLHPMTWTPQRPPAHPTPHQHQYWDTSGGKSLQGVRQEPGPSIPGAGQSPGARMGRSRSPRSRGCHWEE